MSATVNQLQSGSVELKSNDKHASANKQNVAQAWNSDSSSKLENGPLIAASNRLGNYSTIIKYLKFISVDNEPSADPVDRPHST